MGLVGAVVVGAVAVTMVFQKNMAATQAKVTPKATAEEATELLQALDQGSVNLAERVLPSVVSIDTTSNRFADSYVIGSDLRARFFDRQVRSEYGVGSGVIISPEGHIVTNHHVVKALDLKNGEDRLDVWMHEGTKPEPVELLGWNEAADIAVLKLKNPQRKALPYLNWGNSEEMRMGSLVFAFGSPFGLSETMTSGRISNNHRQLTGTGDAMRFFQTDCVINPGNSGGPLVNYRGEVIGINWAIYSDQANDHSWQGIGLVLPGNHVKEVVEALIEKKTVTPYVGLDFADKIQDGKTRVVISTVDAASAASRAGLKLGDVVEQVNAEPPPNAVAAWRMVTKASSKGGVRFSILRSDGVTAEAELTFPR
jgi:S1-C subfamily serine protease